MSDQKNNQEPQMPFGAALFCMLFLLGSMVASMLWLDIPIHIDLLLSIGVTLLVAYLCNGHQWKPLSDAIDYGGKICIQPTIIMMTIGCVVASWIACGTVPMIIYWGLKLINPSVSLLTSCLITAIVAIPIGSSWSAAGTIGVALMGIGMGLGVNPAMTAGAVVSGAYLGDKMSPMSDTTNLAPAVAEADLFDHIKSMMYTTGPAFVVTLIVYGLLGLQYDASSVDSEMVTMMTAAIQENFHMNILLLLPAVAVIVMAVCKCPSIPTLMVSTLVAVVLAMLVQGQTLSGILRQTRSRPRKYESATRRSQRLRVRKGNCAGAPDGASAAGMGRIIRAAGHDAPGISQKPEAEVRCCVMAGRTLKIDRTPAERADILLFCRRFGIIALCQ